MEEIIDRLNARIRDLEERVKDLEDCEEAKIGNSDNSREFPKDGDRYYYIGYDGSKFSGYWYDSDFNKTLLSLGNCFKTEEEAEQAVEKLEAWKRLKDAGFEFNGWEESCHENSNLIYCKIPNGLDPADLDLLFGGDDE